MKNPVHYGKTKLIKIGDYNISESSDIITIPHYLTLCPLWQEERRIENAFSIPFPLNSGNLS